MIEIIIIWIVLAILVTIWASKWGRSAVFYFLVSIILSPVIGAIVLLISGKSTKGSKKCPACAEMVKAEARICRFCRHDFTKDETAKPDLRLCPFCNTYQNATKASCENCGHDFSLPQKTTSSQ